MHYLNGTSFLTCLAIQLYHEGHIHIHALSCNVILKLVANLSIFPKVYTVYIQDINTFRKTQIIYIDAKHKRSHTVSIV